MPQWGISNVEIRLRRDIVQLQKKSVGTDGFVELCMLVHPPSSRTIYEKALSTTFKSNVRFPIPVVVRQSLSLPFQGHCVSFTLPGGKSFLFFPTYVPLIRSVSW